MRRNLLHRPVLASGTALAALAVLGAGGYALFTGWQQWRQRAVDEQIDRFAATIERCSREQNLPVALIRSVIWTESGGRADAVSRTGAKGLMQIMPDAETDALARLKIERRDLFDGDYNIRIGTAYLRQLLDRFDGDVYLALAAYNWGPTAIARARRENPTLTGRQIVQRFAPKETRDYCEQIIQGRWEKLGVSRGG